LLTSLSGLDWEGIETKVAQSLGSILTLETELEDVNISIAQHDTVLDAVGDAITDIETKDSEQDNELSDMDLRLTSLEQFSHWECLIWESFPDVTVTSNDPWPAKGASITSGLGVEVNIVPAVSSGNFDSTTSFLTVPHPSSYVKVNLSNNLELMHGTYIVKMDVTVSKEATGADGWHLGLRHSDGVDAQRTWVAHERLNVNYAWRNVSGSAYVVAHDTPGSWVSVSPFYVMSGGNTGPTIRILNFRIWVHKVGD
jgi:hypothetical protein